MAWGNRDLWGVVCVSLSHDPLKWALKVLYVQAGTILLITYGNTVPTSIPMQILAFYVLFAGSYYFRNTKRDLDCYTLYQYLDQELQSLEDSFI